MCSDVVAAVRWQAVKNKLIDARNALDGKTGLALHTRCMTKCFRSPRELFKNIIG